jgi:WD40 repeat protein
VAFSPDGGTVAAGTESGTVRIWEFSRASVDPLVQTIDTKVQTIAFSRDGGYIAAGTCDRLGQSSCGGSVWIVATTQRMVEIVCDRAWRNMKPAVWEPIVEGKLPDEAKCDQLPDG